MTERAPRRVDRPEPGFFRLKLVRGGPWVVARIGHAPPTDPITGAVLDRSPVWSAEVSGALVASPSVDPMAAGVYRVWLGGVVIGEEEYRRLGAHEPPKEGPVSHGTMKPLF